MKSRRTKATSIPKKVREAVGERDSYTCIICGRAGIPNAHYIRRSQGGLGIEQNIVTLCYECHHRFDNGDKRQEYSDIIKAYLEKCYPGFGDEERVYDRWNVKI